MQNDLKAIINTPSQDDSAKVKEIILSAIIAENQEESEATAICQQLEAELTDAKPITQWDKKKRNHYLGQLNTLGAIHSEIADKVNAVREATHKAFFMPCDKFFLETKERKAMVKLALGTFNAND